MTIRELYRRNRREEFGDTDPKALDIEKRLVGVQQALFHTMGDALVELDGWSDHEIGRAVNAILERDDERANAPECLRPLWRAFDRTVLMQERIDTARASLEQAAVDAVLLDDEAEDDARDLELGVQAAVDAGHGGDPDILKAMQELESMGLWEMAGLR